MLRRKHLLALLGVVLLVLYINSALISDDGDAERIPVVHYSHVPGMKGYLVWSDRCKMPNIDPYLPEVMTFFKRQKYKPCSTSVPLTRVVFNKTSRWYSLLVNDNAVGEYSKTDRLDCCYQTIERNATGPNADKDVSFSECTPFKGSAKLPPTIDNILVKCHVRKKQVYIHGHAMMPARPDILERFDKWRRNNAPNSNRTGQADPLRASRETGGSPEQRPTSVLMIGIDSISRINLIRAMPKTAQYLYDNEWFEMSGYNKIDDNTFPNLMAVLTGLNQRSAAHKCPPTKQNGLANCNFIWDMFREYGYVTAYGEDETSINTFNYGKMGFEKPPVDYYLRPFLIGAEKSLRVQRKSGLSYCLGLQHSADFVYDYALELAKRFKHDPFFGLFWTNTFSHNAISDCSSMDERMVYYLKAFAALGTLNNTIVVFFSDHGMRFGPTRKTLSGHLEERLPFMFLWLPQHLKQLNPEFVNALSVNKNRLTNPFDLHMTLKHVLALTGRAASNTQLMRPARDCERCQTLLKPVPHNRSCDDIAIEDHWCTCRPYQSIYKKSKVVQKLARDIVDYMNSYVANYRNGSYVGKCVQLHIGSVENAYRAQLFTKDHIAAAGNTTAFSANSSLENYRIIFYTKPNSGLFEATVRYTASTGLLEVTGEISRLNTYSADSDCIGDSAVKKYCSCRKKVF